MLCQSGGTFFRKTAGFNFAASMPSIHLLIQGKVQGVFYRASAKEMAVALNLRAG
jgi:hypothetical protein